MSQAIGRLVICWIHKDGIFACCAGVLIQAARARQKQKGGYVL
jgi:hypothetical protein